jgi:hypothetical protein
VIEDALEHIYSIPGPDIEALMEMTDEMKIYAKTCISLGLVCSFSSLTDLLTTYIQVSIP